MTAEIYEWVQLIGRVSSYVQYLHRVKEVIFSCTSWNTTKLPFSSAESLFDVSHPFTLPVTDVLAASSAVNMSTIKLNKGHISPIASNGIHWGWCWRILHYWITSSMVCQINKVLIPSILHQKHPVKFGISLDLRCFNLFLQNAWQSSFYSVNVWKAYLEKLDTWLAENYLYRMIQRYT